MKKTRRKKRIKMTFIIVTIFILGLIAFWNQPIYRNYNITTDKIQNGFTIVQLSDLHSTSYGKNQKRLIQKIDNANADIILLTGDIVDDINPEEAAYILLRDLVTKYPVYYVDGNHEVWHDNTQKIYQEIQAIGVHILDNTYEKVTINDDQVILAGIMDPSERKQRAKEATVIENLESTGLKALDNESFTILLSHRPEYYELYGEYPVDLTLTGHAHGGQVRIPFLLNGVFAPDQGYKPEYAGGLYNMESYELVVSRGLSLNPRLPRVFNPPEVVIIQVSGGKNEN